MGKTQTKSEELGNSIKKDNSIDDKINTLVQTMEKAREVYLRSLGSMEALQAMKKEQELKEKENGNG